MNFIQFASLLLSGYFSLPTNELSNDHKLDRRLLSPGMGLAYVDVSDLRVLSPESNTFKLNYIAGFGNYHGPDVVYFNPFAQQPGPQPGPTPGPGPNPQGQQPQPQGQQQRANTSQQPQPQAGQQPQQQQQAGQKPQQQQTQPQNKPQAGQQQQAGNQFNWKIQ